jgi:hypothetical protein
VSTQFRDLFILFRLARLPLGNLAIAVGDCLIFLREQPSRVLSIGLLQLCRCLTELRLQGSSPL